MARHAPGLSPSELRRMTPEETDVVLEAVAADVKAAQRFQLELALGVMRACGSRVSV